MQIVLDLIVFFAGDADFYKIIVIETDRGISRRISKLIMIRADFFELDLIVILLTDPCFVVEWKVWHSSFLAFYNRIME